MQHVQHQNPVEHTQVVANPIVLVLVEEVLQITMELQQDVEVQRLINGSQVLDYVNILHQIIVMVILVEAFLDGQNLGQYVDQVLYEQQ